MFTSAKTREIQKEIQAALNAIGEKHGFSVPTVDLRRARHDAFSRLMKMDFFPGKSAANPTVIRAITSTPLNLAAAMSTFGIKKTANTKGDKLIGYNPKCPKYSFTYVSARGAEWTCTPEQAAKRFA